MLNSNKTKMKKSIAILMFCLVGFALSVAAHPVTAKPHFATDFAVSKITNDVVVINFTSNDLGYNYEVSEVIIYKNFESPLTDLSTEAEALFTENRTVTQRESNNIFYSYTRKTKPIYLFVCSIKQCSTGALIRSVKFKS